MNIKIINSALIFIPNRLQVKALAKALNFVLLGCEIDLDDKRVIKIELTDLNRSWLFYVDRKGFNPHFFNSISDITVRSSINVIIEAQDCEKLKSFLENGKVEVIASPKDKKLILSSLKNISQSRLDVLVERGYAFLKLKPKPRFDIKTVTLAEVKTARDVDWLRDEAVKLETSNLSDALRLMEIAHQARPSGPFIKRKVEEYRNVLAQQ